MPRNSSFKTYSTNESFTLWCKPIFASICEPSLLAQIKITMRGYQCIAGTLPNKAKGKACSAAKGKACSLLCSP